MKIQKYYRVKLDYEGKFDDGSIFDSSKHNDHSHPLEFIAGSGMVIKGFDHAVMGMKIGDEKIFSVNPKEAYGENNPELKREISRDNIPAEQEVHVGMIIELMDNNSHHIPAVITEVSDSSITIDLNHPLAGKRLNFHIKILDVKEGNEEDLKAFIEENHSHEHNHDEDHNHKHSDDHECACGKEECSCEGGECECNSNADNSEEGSCCGGNCGCNHSH